MRWSLPRSVAVRAHGAQRLEDAENAAPYLWAYKGRVLFALACLVAAKLATVAVPILLGNIVDGLAPAGPATQSVAGILIVPLALIIAYGALRLSTSLFTELREFFFVKVTQAATRTLALKTFAICIRCRCAITSSAARGGDARDRPGHPRHLFADQLHPVFDPADADRDHTGLCLSALELRNLAMVIVGTSLTIYIVFTVAVTNWRTAVRRRWNEPESKAQSRAVDSLLNFETVKYFGNENYEARRYDETWPTRNARRSCRSSR